MKLKNKTLWKRIFYTLIAFAVYRLGCAITIPFINSTALTEGMSKLGLLDMISLMGGGGLDQFSIFALGVTPYITASIIIQLLSMDVIPYLTQLTHDGHNGKVKIESYTKYLAIILSVVQSVGIIFAINNQSENLFIGGITPMKVFFCTVILTAGMIWLTWLAGQITKKGLGNGMSMIIMAGIVGRLPDQFLTAQQTLGWTYKFGLYILAMFIILVGITALNTIERKIPVQYTTSSVKLARKNNKSNYLPFKINSASVLPVIFASSVMMAPITIMSFMEKNEVTEVLNNILGMKTWYSLVIYGLLVWFFTFFYVHVQMDAKDMADNLDKSGSYIHEVRPGAETEDFLYKSISRVTVLGAIGITIIALLPHIMPLIWTEMPSSMALGGTGLIIVVGVALETTKQIRSLLTQFSYKKYYKVAGIQDAQ